MKTVRARRCGATYANHTPHFWFVPDVNGVINTLVGECEWCPGGGRA